MNKDMHIHHISEIKCESNRLLFIQIISKKLHVVKKCKMKLNDY